MILGRFLKQWHDFEVCMSFQRAIILPLDFYIDTNQYLQKSVIFTLMSYRAWLEAFLMLYLKCKMLNVNHFALLIEKEAERFESEIMFLVQIYIVASKIILLS